MDKKEKLIGKEEIKAIYEDEERQFNVSTLEEGIRQAELRLKDINSTRAKIMKRADSLFSFLTSLIFAFTSLIIVLVSLNPLGTLNSSDSFFSLEYGYFMLLILISIILILFVFVVLKPIKRLSLGVQPKFWLKEDVVSRIVGRNTRENKTKGKALAFILYNYQKKIEEGLEVNEKATKLVNYAWRIVVLLPFVLSVLSVILYSQL